MTGAKRFKVGQTLWYVPTNHSRDKNSEKRGEAVTINKVDPKWVYFDGGHWLPRMSAETMFADGKGYSSPGRFYLDEDAYKLDLKLEKAWTRLYQRIYRSKRPNSLEAIEQVAKLLEIDLEKD